MPTDFTDGLKRFIWWDYPRGSRQYDVMVVIILAFVFLTPRAWFRDQPRVPRANSIVMQPADRMAGMHWIDPESLAGIPENQWPAKVSEIIKAVSGKNQPVLRLQPVYDDSEHELKGYVAFTNP